MDSYEYLTDIAADWLSERAHEPSVWRLLSGVPGQWVSLARIYAEDSALSARLDETSLGDVVHAVWLPFERSAYGDGYCTITLFCESLGWSTTAIYNRERLRRRFGDASA